MWGTRNNQQPLIYSPELSRFASVGSIGFIPLGRWVLTSQRFSAGFFTWFLPRNHEAMRCANSNHMLYSCKLTVRWLENPPNFDGIYQERWGFSWAMLVSGSVIQACKMIKFSSLPLIPWSSAMLILMQPSGTFG